MSETEQNNCNIFTRLATWWHSLTKPDKLAQRRKNSTVEKKLNIGDDSTSKPEQRNFINEGGNSQPLD
ncbi:MAG: hypothetical protein QG673_1509 [Pseudomonadota bacterium]|nr:hypothetical protein [Pseudomonadota bacterium]